MNVSNHLKRKTYLSFITGLLFFSVLSGTLSSCVLITDTHTSTDEVKNELTQTEENPATQELALIPETEMPTEMPSIIQTPEPTATLETAPVNMNEVIDLTKLSPEQIAMVNEEMIKRIEQFKKGEICGDKVMEESGFFQRDDLVDRDAYLGVITAVTKDYVDFQGCVLAGFIQNNQGNNDKEYENLFLMIGYEKKIGRDRSVTLLQLDYGTKFAANMPFFMEYRYTNANNGVGNIKNFSSKDDLLAFWNKNLEKPVLFNLSFIEDNTTDDQWEYLKNIGVDLVLAHEYVSRANLTKEINKNLALSSYCKTNNDIVQNIVCEMVAENSPTEINSLSDALLLMDGRPNPLFNRWCVVGLGPQE